MGIAGKISQNIVGIETNMNTLEKLTSDFMETTPFLGDENSTEKECKGNAYEAIKDNDKTTYEILQSWCELSNELVSFLRSDVEAFKEADAGK